jgi:hypothetical protein
MQKKVFQKIQHPFILKAPNKLGIERLYFNIKKTIKEIHVASIILRRKKLKPPPLKS